MAASRKLLLLFLVGLAACAMGCASRRVDVLSARCEDSRQDGRLKALAFVTTFEARNLEGEQLIYQVRLFDRDRSPLRSRDGRYQTSDGIVAATTSMIVHQSPQAFKNVRVSIPVEELGVPPNRIPVLVEMTVRTARGELVGQSWRTLPSLKPEEVMPPLKEAPVYYWFSKVVDPNRLPILQGPFPTSQEAREKAGEGTEIPKQMTAEDYLWFVPFWGPRDTGNVFLVGPFCCQEDAKEIPRLFESIPNPELKGLVAGAPVEVQVQQWLKQRGPQSAGSVPESSPGP